MGPSTAVGAMHTVAGESGSVLDVSLLFAMFIYGMLAIGTHALIGWLTVRSRR
jgi:hypothetical protein